MTEEGISRSLTETEKDECRELRATSLQNKSRSQSESEPQSESVMAAPKPCKLRTFRTSRKASTALENQMEI